MLRQNIPLSRQQGAELASLGTRGISPLQQHLVGGQRWAVLILGEEGEKWHREQKYSAKTTEISHVLGCGKMQGEQDGHSTARGGISTQK